MLEYIFKSALSLAMLYSLFFACLSRETFHRFNRVALLFTMMASLVLPFVHLSVSHPTAVQEAMQMPTEYLTELPVIQIHSALIGEGTGKGLPLTWGQLLTYIYLAGVGAMLLFLLVQTFQMYRLMQGGLRHTDNQGNTVILKPSVRSPFSLFRWIVMSVDDYEQHRQSILTHEQEHIRLGHTYDLLLLEAMRIFQWFNPFIWLLGHDLRAIHEYEADEAVINQGIDAKQYQQLLVLKAVGNRLQPFANTLGRGSLKQRIMMMYQKKSNRWMMLKALFVIPTMCFALYAFATPEAMPEIKNVLEKKVSLPSKAQPASMLEGEMQSMTDAQGNFTENESDPAVDNVDEDNTVKGGDEPTVLPLEPTQEQVEYIVNNLEEPIEALVAGLDGEITILFHADLDGTVSAPRFYSCNITDKSQHHAPVKYGPNDFDKLEADAPVNAMAEACKRCLSSFPKSLVGTRVQGEWRTCTFGFSYRLEAQPIVPKELNAGDKINGRVVEMNTGGKSLTGVHVNQLDANGKVVAATVTDANGEFQMTVNAPKNTLQFSLGGYDTAEYAMDADMYIGLARQE